MSDTQAEIPIGTPMRDAWEAYKLTTDYANTRRWAIHQEHVDGSLWASFVSGWNAARAPSRPCSNFRQDVEKPRNDWCVCGHLLDHHADQPAPYELCSDCPPEGYPSEKTRCAPCPRRQSSGEG